jgi:hypothetical protein
LKLNIIIGNRSERLPRLKKELEVQGITNVEFWNGVYKNQSAKENISAAHRQIVEYAKLAGWPMVAIGEDDLKFFAPGAWDYFVSTIPPVDFDIYLSSVYTGDIRADNTTEGFTGFHLYIVHARFYDLFLGVNPHEHIDRALKGLGKYVVCDPMIAEQYDGWSSNTKKSEKYRSLLSGKNLFGI